MLLSVCSNAEILSVLRIVKILLNTLRYSVTVILILSLTLDFARATNDSDKLKSAFNGAIKKSIAAVLVLFIPTYMRLLVSLVNNDFEYQECLNNATVENINAAYAEYVDKLMNNAIKNVSFATYEEAKVALNKLSDENKKKEYSEKLKDTKNIIDAERLVNIVEKSHSTSDYEKAVASLDNITDKEYKAKLEERLKTISYQMSSYVSQYSSGGYVSNPLGLPYYNQCDSRWGNIRYDTGGATLCSSACGYTSFAMIAAGLNNDMSITPYTVIQKMRGKLPTSRGYGAASTGELLNSSYLSFYHLSGQSILSGNTENKKRQILSALNQRKAIILLVPGHYIVLTPGTQNSNVIVMDPFTGWASSAKRSGEMTIDAVYNAYGEFRWAAAYSAQY